MKIIKSQTFTVEMTLEELTSLKKFIGETSTTYRIGKLGLTEAQDKAVSDVFDTLYDYFYSNPID